MLGLPVEPTVAVFSLRVAEYFTIILLVLVIVLMSLRLVNLIVNECPSDVLVSELVSIANPDVISVSVPELSTKTLTESTPSVKPAERVS